MAYGRHRPASVSSLPVEVLLMIFKIIDHDTRNLCHRIESLTPSAALFPYAVAHVCTLWKEIATTIPQFWTRLTIPLDPTSNLFIELENYLQLSRDLPFQLRLASPYYDTDDASANDDEKSSLLVAVKLLLPHLHRCQSLFILVLWGSSLPPLSTIWSSFMACEKLEVLKLQCLVHDACAAQCPVSSVPVPPPVSRKLPPLVTLSLSADAVFLYRQPFVPSPFDSLQDLTLINYNARVSQHGEHTLTTSSLIEMLRATPAKSITLINLYFDQDFLLVVPLDLAHATPTYLQCESLQGHVVSAVCLLYQQHLIDHMWITSSLIDSVVVFPTYHLELSYIGGRFPHDAFRNWEGSLLFVHGCPSFDDSFLRNITKFSNGRYGCNQLTMLSINDCLDISIPTLKSLVRRRWEKAREEFEWNNLNEMECHQFSNVAPIARLMVDEHIGARLSEEDTEWLKSRLHLHIASSSESSDDDEEKAMTVDEGDEHGEAARYVIA